MGETGSPWLNDHEKAAWVRLIALVELLPGILDTQLRKDHDLMHYEYYVLAMLSEAPEDTLQLRELASQTNATLPRLSHVIRRLEKRGFVERIQSEQDRRATYAVLTPAGRDIIVAAAPDHAATVRKHVFDALNEEQVENLTDVTSAILSAVDPKEELSPSYTRYDLG